MYYEEMTNEFGDGLLGGGEFPIDIRNVSIGGAVERGMILAGTSGVYAEATASDTNKTLCIAYQDEESDCEVTSAYFAGLFNREDIKAADSVTSALEQSLRTQNIILTSCKE